MYYYKTQSLLLTLTSGLFLLTQVLGHPAPMAESLVPEGVDSAHPGGLTCATISSSSSPLAKDCRKALEKIQPTPITDSPGTCITRVYRPVATPAVVGTCTVEIFSDMGRAHCQNSNDVRKGIQAILSGCSSSCQGVEYAQGSYIWTMSGQPNDGVRLIRTPGV